MGRLAQVVEKKLRTPGSSPDLVCERHAHFGRQPAIRFNEPRDPSPNFKLSRIDSQQKEISINSEPTGVLPRPTDQSEDQDGGASAGSIEQGAGDNKGLPAEDKILTGSYRWCSWDTAGPAEWQCGTA